jgi:hypothetical protein
MEHAQPRGLSRRRVQELLSKTRPDRPAGNRIEILSRHFLGHPYQIKPLIGSSSTPEVFTVSFDAFDCVTYIETILALALSSNVEEFPEWLRKIRYEKGLISWKHRNHYMTGWIRSNLQSGALRRMPLPSSATVMKDRLLEGIPGLPPQRVRFSCVPRRSLGKLVPLMETGDLIFFASTRKHLDVFHCGILVRDGGRILVRHASRSRGGVVEQELNDFLKGNRMSGIITARPKEPLS